MRCRLVHERLRGRNELRESEPGRQITGEHDAITTGDSEWRYAWRWNERYLTLANDNWNRIKTGVTRKALGTFKDEPGLRVQERLPLAVEDWGALATFLRWRFANYQGWHAHDKPSNKLQTGFENLGGGTFEAMMLIAIIRQCPVTTILNWNSFASVSGLSSMGSHAPSGFPNPSSVRLCGGTLRISMQPVKGS